MAMSMHRWRLRRILGWLIPVVAYLCVLVIMTASYRASAEERAFSSDAAYRNLVVANTLIESRMYGPAADQAAPMVQDMLWRVIIAGAQWVVADGVTAIFLLGMIFGVLTLLQLIRLCRVIFPYPMFSYYSAGLAVLSPGLAAAALSGLAVPVAMFLITAAVVRHLEDVTGSGPGMPLATTLFIGLALWVRLEFLVVWVLLLLHTLLVGLVPGDQRPSILNTLGRGVNGLLILALFLLPVFAWNIRILEVPWPRLPGVPMAADLWALEGPAAAWNQTVVLMREGWAGATELFRATALPGVLLGRFFFWFGILLLLIQGIRSREERPHVVLLLLMPFLVPILFGVLYPYMGWSALPVIAASFVPVMLVITAYGVIRFPFVIEGLAGKWLPPVLLTQRAYAGWWLVAGGLLVLFSLAAQVREARTDARMLRAHVEERHWLDSVIREEGLKRDRFLSDEPGWLVWEHGLAVIDLHAEWSPEWLTFVDLEGEYEVDRVRNHVERLNPPPGVLAVWDPVFRPLADILPEAETLREPHDDHPERGLIVIANWPGVL